MRFPIASGERRFFPEVVVDASNHWAEICRELGRATSADVRLERVTPVGGGCIHGAVCLETSGGRWFVKHNRADLGPLLETEKRALEEMRETGCIRVPQPCLYLTINESAFLVMEYLPMGNGSRRGWEAMGRSLAKMHALQRPCYGWMCDNFIGETPQTNRKTEDWAVFYREQRLKPMLCSLADRGVSLPGADRLLDRLEELLDPPPPHPSLLHGDLWGGNAGFLESGEPVVFDPAAYWGDSEADLALTTLFGGFPEPFYAAYREVLPLREGWRQRQTLYNLYHVLNHALLFGGGYAGQAGRMIRDLV